MLGRVTVGTVWNKIDGAANVYIGRSSLTESPLGNPYVINGSCNRDQACDKYEPYLRAKLKDKGSKARAEMSRIAAMVIAGKHVNLLCYCSHKNYRCHGDFIKKLIDAGVKRKLQK